MNSRNPDKLEASIDRVLRSVPERRAPAGLEARVLAEIARRQALPWWRRSFAHWPVALRVFFFVGSAVAGGVLVSGLLMLMRTQGVSEIAAGTEARFVWLQQGRELLASVQGLARTLFNSIPSLYFYGALAFLGAAYAMLGAIGATAYRALSLQRVQS